ncbi:phage portal protein [Pseudovibrio sp. Ad26]|uniref:phage portal protein n=1 Tax=Pseudovibrio sp. Ad26 TaxID=989410 RepID=UPI0007AEC28C|nr:phage portal protein [Pseudovibrio sp. Ad26]KZL10705.1 Phage portal protein, lambda family [Pseudovibrio sp. Ad26]
MTGNGLTRPKVRVQAKSRQLASSGQRFTMRYLRGDPSGTLAKRTVSNRLGSEDVRAAAVRASALATDFMHNSGWIAGAIDQVITDTIGNGLTINYKPDLSKLGYDEKETKEFAALVEQEFRAYADDPLEVDLAGEKKLSEMDDGTCRIYATKGETYGVYSFLSPAERKRYGIKTGTKVSLVSPSRLKWESNQLVGLEDGIFKDVNGRHQKYRFQRRGKLGSWEDHDIEAFDRAGLRQVVQLMDRSENPDASRGVPLLTSVLNNIGYQEQLGNATLATALAQAIMAATVKSPDASQEIFQAFQTLEDDYEDIGKDLADLWRSRLEALQEGTINLTDGVRVNHLAPGEEFELHSSKTPNPHYVAFFQNLLREVARRIGATASSVTMDHTGATYSSVRMEYASIWPVVTRRRNRVVAPLTKVTFANWLDESIAEGRLPFKGGYEAFKANRKTVSQVDVLGPAQPTADDEKKERARKQRLENAVSSVRRECAADGVDYDQVQKEIADEKKEFEKSGRKHPSEKVQGGGGKSEDAPKKPKAKKTEDGE